MESTLVVGEQIATSAQRGLAALCFARSYNKMSRLDNHPKIPLVVIDLFAGISALSVALSKVKGSFDVRRVLSYENDKDARTVLRARGKEYHGDRFELHGKVQSLGPFEIKRIVEDYCSDKNTHVLICGGSPCQDLSQAGVDEGRVAKGIVGKRSALFLYIPRIIYWFKKLMLSHFGEKHGKLATYRGEEKYNKKKLGWVTREERTTHIITNIAAALALLAVISNK